MSSPTSSFQAARFHWLDLFHFAAAMTVVAVHARGTGLAVSSAGP